MGEFIDNPGRLTVTARISRSLQTPGISRSLYRSAERKIGRNDPCPAVQVSDSKLNATESPKLFATEKEVP